MNKYDAIIIGAVRAGPSLAARLAAAGWSLPSLNATSFGGTCVNTGRIPTKALVSSATQAHVARQGAEYGFVVDGDVRVDMKRVKARKDEVSGRSTMGVEEWLRGLQNSVLWIRLLADLASSNCAVIQGHARFMSSRTVVVNDEVLEADKVFKFWGLRFLGPEAMNWFRSGWTSCPRRLPIRWYSAQCVFIRRLRIFSPPPCPNWDPLSRRQSSAADTTESDVAFHLDDDRIQQFGSRFGTEP
jgi:hypothetical protein